MKVYLLADTPNGPFLSEDFSLVARNNTAKRVSLRNERTGEEYLFSAEDLLRAAKAAWEMVRPMDSDRE